jgi:hypothetical protein
VSAKKPPMISNQKRRLLSSISDDADAKIRSLAKTELARAYPRLLEEAKKRLKKHFNPQDYLTVEQLVQRFYLSYQLLEIKPPDPEKLDAKLFRKEKEKWEKIWTDAAENADRLLSVGMVEQIKKLLANLAPSSDGKQKRIAPTSLDGLNEFLATFNPRNMQNNQQLKALADRAKEIIKGVNPEVLRQSKNARDFVRVGFEQIEKKLAPMVESKPTRAISLEDE